MSFNITSDGSPTPRKGPGRASKAAELTINTSPEVLGQAVGSTSHSHYQYVAHRMLNPTLTSNLQGVKQPLGPSTLSNQSMPAQLDPIDAYKVSSL